MEDDQSPVDDIPVAQAGNSNVDRKEQGQKQSGIHVAPSFRFGYNGLSKGEG
ncbi:hypothetical protein GMD88_17805 [Pseudoflavonifractor sp. BIOML-A6]|jgi:hypothetical protein|nr:MULTISPECIES: hypothetical protein [unclassified Pseudoflavonifractor]MTQ98634.1 hypothetical protein [Pseudoflavonifractor sp. BIOML-A16]MTR07932.1 hypothetical protein [Pseudoflavonifractor sp. BIOML-A15]MTR34099.1 hypothetical protein [Pseudoflavonifractor sp. BIOML-A14]MTS66096.1 hypothetical protein [Pseudoflavonifractor sp. BIOML-A5]MTS73488.1 hypothetical protein [Pseudoflavonifractor sp. BIOML-A8]MTS92654.1 hypothetical protein [Pseudoflavonifractor sp. BIOML-A4]